MSKELIETLDALNNERPGILQSKRRHFGSEKYGRTTRSEHVSLMRLGAEKDRVDKFKLVAMQQTRCYYSILEKFLKIIDERREKDA